MASLSVSAHLRHFNAHAIVDQEIHYTIVGGRFSPTINIDLTRQVVILSVAGANGFRLAIPADSFRKTLLGYEATVNRRSSETAILLQPFSSGDWAYSAGIK